jgi:PKD repeat protein
MKSLNDAVGEIMAPIGKAWNASLAQYPSTNLYYTDDTHSNETGSYLATAVIYSTVFRENPINNTYEGLVGNSTTAANMRQLAWDAVSNTTYQTECNFAAHTADISFANPTLTCTGLWSAYQWVNNNTNYISGAISSTYNITEAADYYVVVTDADGCKTRSFEIPCSFTSTGEPTAQFSGTPTTIYEGETVAFSDLSGDGGNTISSWAWTFAGSTTPTYNGQNPPAIIYNNAGTYEVTLTVTNSQGPDIEQKTGYITVLAMGGIYSRF